MKLRCLAPAKVNLNLTLGPVRSDGRHELVTLFESLSLGDELELETLEAGDVDRVLCPGVEGENLAGRALAMLRERGWGGPPVAIRIRKRIPIAAGMAGGSADAAAVLRLAMAIAPGRPGKLDAIAASLGADVPSQLTPGVSIGTGAGELVEPYPPLPEHAFVVVPSDRRLATPAVFSEADRLGLPRSRVALGERRAELGAALRGGHPLPGELTFNDLEPAAVSLCPSVADALDQVRMTGADQTLVSGSGPTVIGLWWGEGAEGLAAAAASSLQARFAGATAAGPVDPATAAPRRSP
jgi:4-diphosphocytidyl-2-C-methyl-D-erythritol kinase